MRRRRTIIGLAVVTLIVGGLIVWLSGPRLDRSRLRKVHDGMTREEVIATLGSRPQQGADGADDFRFNNWPLGDVWEVDEGVFVVWYDANDRVTGRAIMSGPGDSRPWLVRRFHRLRGRLGL